MTEKKKEMKYKISEIFTLADMAEYKSIPRLKFMIMMLCVFLTFTIKHS